MDTPPSLFRQSILAFLRVFFGGLGLFLAFLVGLAVLGGFSNGSEGMISRSEYEILPDKDWKREVLPITSPVILTLKIHGVIGDRNLTAEQIQQHLLTSQEGEFSNDRVKGIILSIDTPGGEATAADSIYRLILDYKQHFKVPVYAFINGSCTSGGLYIAAACDKIFATTGSMVGSIGVISWPPFYNIATPLEALGIKTKTLFYGKGKDEMNPFRPWEAEEGEEVSHLLEAFYLQFVDIICQARPKVSKDCLINTWGAHVWTAQEAADLGIIDGTVWDFNRVLQAICQEALIPESAQIQVIAMTSSHWLQDLLGTDSPLTSGKVSHRLEMNDPQGKFPFQLR